MAFFSWLESQGFSVWVRESGSIWAFPVFLFAHTLGMSIVAGCSTFISFALLGLWPKDAPIKPLEKMYPVLPVSAGTKAALPKSGKMRTGCIPSSARTATHNESSIVCRPPESSASGE